MNQNFGDLSFQENSCNNDTEATSQNQNADYKQQQKEEETSSQEQEQTEETPPRDQNFNQIMEKFFQQQPQTIRPTPLISNHDQEQFSSRQHQRPVWQEGQRCMAKYWEDEQFYEAIITDMSPNTAVVLFEAYGNNEEVFLSDLRPLSGGHHQLQ